MSNSTTNQALFVGSPLTSQQLHLTNQKIELSSACLGAAPPDPRVGYRLAWQSEPPFRKSCIQACSLNKR